MEVKRILVEKAATLISKNPTLILTEKLLLENDQERVHFDLFFADFNGLLLELKEHIHPFILENIQRFLFDFKTKPIHRIINLYQFYIDGYVNETPNIFNSSHINLIGYSGNEAVKIAANKLLDSYKNALINCINDARRQNLIDVNESETLVEYMMMAWEGAIYQQKNSGSSKPLFLYMNMLRLLLNT